MLETNTFMQNRQRKIVLTIWMCLMTDRLLECPCRKNRLSEQDNQVRFFLLNDVANEETTFFQTTDVIFLSWYGSGVSQKEFIWERKQFWFQYWPHYSISGSLLPGQLITQKPKIDGLFPLFCTYRKQVKKMFAVCFYGESMSVCKISLKKAVWNMFFVPERVFEFVWIFLRSALWRGK